MLTPKGYKVKKAGFADEESVRADLLVRPASASHHPPPPAFSVLKESVTSLYLPRCYATERLGPAAGVAFPSAVPAPRLQFAGTLRPVQQAAIDAYMREALHGSGAGTIVIGCGGGKTCSALAVMCRLGVKTLVVVHKLFLATQWTERISQFVPGARVGVMKGDKYVHEDCDIVVASLQTMISRKHPLAGFGLTVYDECHHMAAKVFVTSLMYETTRYVLGLTATPERKDGLGRVFLWFLGSVVYRPPAGGGRRTDVRVQFARLPQRCRERCDFSGRPDTVAMVTDLVNCAERTRDVAALCATVLRDPSRCVLVLSERRKHLEDLHAELAAAHGGEMGYYVGGMKADARAAVEARSRVILASFSMAAEGMDIPRLNTLVLASPKSDVVQSVGRIMRTEQGVGPVAPLIVDVVDPLFAGPAAKRRALYRKMGYALGLDADEDGPASIAFSVRALRLSQPEAVTGPATPAGGPGAAG